MSARKKVRRLTRRQIFRYALGAGAGLFAYSTLIEPNWLETTRTRIPIKNLPKPFDGYRIGLVSDIHWPEMIEPGFMGRIGEILKSEQVDLVCVPGDLADDTGHPVMDFRGIFDNWTAPDGQLATLGNHDHWYDADIVRKQVRENTPFKLIDNERVLIERGGEAIAIAGVGDMWEDVVDPERALGGLDPEMPRILLSHNPDLAHDFPGGYRVDLQLSGHMHGGQICLGPRVVAAPSKYGDTFARGLVQGRRNLVYVTKGICRWRLHARFCARPEVSIIELKSANS